MNQSKTILIFVLVLAAAVFLAGCFPQGPCDFTAAESLTVFRLPDPASDVFGTMAAGESHGLLAYTADGWIGFDPGIAQAGNIGLAHHRWVQMNATIEPSCLLSVDEVTLAEVMADMAASGH